MKDRVPTLANEHTSLLAEGPWWDAAHARLLWVDILERTLYEGRLEDGRVDRERSTEFPWMLGAVATSADGDILLAAQDRLAVLRSDNTLHEGPQLLPAGGTRRLNDGTTDPKGRYIVGSLAMEPTTSYQEALFCIDHDGSVSILDDELSLSNGIAWSHKGERMFHADSLRGCIWVRDYDVETATVGVRRPFVQLAAGAPDGIAMDVEDHLWVAVWGPGEVHRYAPDGTLTKRLSLPSPHTSCVAFAGKALDTLVITTATAELSPTELRKWEHAGKLFTLTVDVPGLPVTPWCGSFGRQKNPHQ